MSKEEIDRIFQKGSENYRDEFPYNPVAWKHMEQLLDRKNRRRRLLFWFLGGGAVLLLVAAVLVTRCGRFPAHAPGQQAVEKPVENQEPGSSDAPSNGKENLEHNLPNSPTPAILPPQPEQPVAQKGQQPSIHRSGVPGRQEPHPTLPQKETTFEQNSVKPDHHPGPSENMNESAGAANQPEIQRSPFAASPELPARHPALLSYPSAPLTWVSPETAGTDSSKNNRPRFFASVDLAPNFSAVGFSTRAKTGSTVGLNLGYRLGQRQSISLGVQWAKMNYRAGKGAYTPPKGFWTRKIAPDETLGECVILEIPLTLTHHFGTVQQDGWFVQSGISSYLMLEEHYYYRYNQPEPDLIRYWGGENENQHWLGVINLAAGFRKIIHPKWSLLFGPYANIPLRGVGHGKVDLYNFGLNVNVGFRR